MQNEDAPTLSKWKQLIEILESIKKGVTSILETLDTMEHELNPPLVDGKLVFSTLAVEEETISSDDS